MSNFTLILCRRIPWDKVTWIHIFSMRNKIFLIVIPTRCHCSTFHWFSSHLIKCIHLVSIRGWFLFRISKNALRYWSSSSFTKCSCSIRKLCLNIWLYYIQRVWLSRTKPLLFTKWTFPTGMSPCWGGLIPFRCLFFMRLISIF